MKHRRRRYIVDAGFQWRFAAGFIVAALMGSVAATILFNALATKRLEELRWSVFITAQSTGEVLKPIFIYVNIFSLIFISILLFITWKWMLNKINGPLFRMVKDLKLIQEGNFSTDITLRRKDEFDDVAAAFNDMLARMRQSFGEFRVRYEEISQALVELEVAHAQGRLIKEDVDKLIGMVQNLQNNI